MFLSQLSKWRFVLWHWVFFCPVTFCLSAVFICDILSMWHSVPVALCLCDILPKLRFVYMIFWRFVLCHFVTVAFFSCAILSRWHISFCDISLIGISFPVSSCTSFCSVTICLHGVLFCYIVSEWNLDLLHFVSVTFLSWLILTEWLLSMWQFDDLMFCLDGNF